MSIDGEAYVMTVIDTRSGDLQMRQSISKIADYISRNPSF
jgi:beta-lactamase class A